MDSFPDALPTYRSILRTAWPIILANAAVPMLGLTDATVIGQLGSVSDLGAIALGTLVFNFLFWGFGFLRMGTSGFTAQADGAHDEAEVRATLLRALLLAAGLGWLLILMRGPLGTLAFFLLNGSESVETTAREYFEIRILGAPAALSIFSLMGCLIGLGQSRRLLFVQLTLSSLNIVLDVLFAAGLGFGVRGIAWGTAIAEWATLGVAGYTVHTLLLSRMSDQEDFFSAARIFDGRKLRHTLSANTDIMIRTLLLVLAFSWFADAGARLGDVVLAANHLLLQFVSISAFFLDAYAFVVESLVGRALGSRHSVLFRVSLRRSSELALATAVLLSAGILALHFTGLSWFTRLPRVDATATRFAPLAALYVCVAVAAFQLDGVFIGALRTRQMRNASAQATAAFGAILWLAADGLDNTRLWLAFIAYALARAVTLLRYLPRLERSMGDGPQDACEPIPE